MKNTIFLFTFLFITSLTFAASGIFQTYAVINSGSGNTFYAGGLNPENGTSFNGQSFGTPSSLVLNGGEVKTFKNGFSDVFDAEINYRVYKQGYTPPPFTTINLPFGLDLGGGNQSWRRIDAGVDLLALADDGNGTYNIEVFWKATTSDGDSFDSNSGNNFTATFMVAMMPVELSHFSAKVENNSSVALTWTTSQELSNDYFEVERKTGATAWTAIGKIQGAGNSDEAIDYSFIDLQPAMGDNYYRLRQTDFDGTTDYSGIVNVQLTRATTLIYPNPTASYLTVDLPEATSGNDLEIYDVEGRIVLSTPVEHQQEIDVNNLSPSIYFIRISDNHGNTIATQQFRKL